MPSDLSPTHYDLTIQPYFKPTDPPEMYKAWIAIDFTCTHETDKLVLHMNAVNLKLDNSTLKLTSSSDSSFGAWEEFAWSWDSVTSFFTVRLEQARRFRVGQEYRFEVAFEGKIQDNLVGFYRSSYSHTEDGQT